MTKKDLVIYISDTIGYPKKEAYQIVETFFEEIKEAIEKGEQIKISGFGIFDVNHKKERIGRNPKTKKEVTIAERNVLKFHSSQVLKKLLNEQ